LIEQVIEKWHDYLQSREPDRLDELLDDDVVFYSPIVFTPQRGKAVTALYLSAAAQTFPGDRPAGPGGSGPEGSEARVPGSFRYTKTVMAGDTAVLEFETTIQSKYVNGVDIIRCNPEGRIIEFRVMIRPLQAVELVHRQMAAMLERMAPDA
jgi:hypothetical protein